MGNFYYKIWADAIISSRKKPELKDSWKSRIILIMTMLTALNLITVWMWLGYFNVKTVLVDIQFFPGTMLDSFASFVIQFGLPCFLLNYFLIFHKGRYKKLMTRYPDKNGKLVLAYVFITIAVFIIPVLFYMWLR